MIEAAYQVGQAVTFFSSSACVYKHNATTGSQCAELKESDAYPAMAERGYGGKVLISEISVRNTGPERGTQDFRRSIPQCLWYYAPGTAARKSPAAILSKGLGRPSKTINKMIEFWGTEASPQFHVYQRLRERNRTKSYTAIS